MATNNEAGALCRLLYTTEEISASKSAGNSRTPDPFTRSFSFIPLATSIGRRAEPLNLPDALAGAFMSAPSPDAPPHFLAARPARGQIEPSPTRPGEPWRPDRAAAPPQCRFPPAPD